ncbi:MAG: NAD(P)/FAD-dependent oxidoreductase [Spirochaetes bacterium]|nr:NAD(P)/FAD-dependent oxidoreductase [Spirochaetota bacterium]
MQKTDVLIIGAGVVGCAIARELSKYRVRVLVVDKNEDVGGEASKANSAIIHTGFDAPPGSLESELVNAANPMYEKLCADLDIPFAKIGAIMPAFTNEQFEQLPAIKEKAFKNKVYDVEYLTAEQLLEREPNLNPCVKAGLFIPREYIIDPFLLVVAYAENALENSASFLLNTKITGISTNNGAVAGIETTAGRIEARYIVNAAGLYCDEVAAMVGKADYTVNPRKGQFYILDKNTSCKVNHIVLPIPTKLTKGKLMCPTIHGNMLVGPTAEDLLDKEDYATDAAGLASIREDVSKLIPDIKFGDAIMQYAGLRANRNPEGLRVDTYDDVKGYVNLSGIRSTGITASAALGKYVAQTLIQMGMPAEFKADFIEKRKGIIRFHELSRKQQDDVIRKNPLFGKVICRCETVTEGEIAEAVRRPLPARSMDAVKRRLRAGMGRCSGGFCGPRVLEILARELNVSVEEINKNQSGSYMVTGEVRAGKVRQGAQNA